jgi:hypothetical protein
MTQVYVLYKTSTAEGFYADDISDDLKTQILSENSGKSFSTNTIDIPEPNDDYSNVVFPHHVTVEDGVARILTGTELDDANAADLALFRLNEVRELRNKKITETDWWANSDLTMTQAQIDYRQALRDITNTYSSLDGVVWPLKP